MPVHTLIISDTFQQAQQCAQELNLSLPHWAWITWTDAPKLQGMRRDTECIFYGPCNNVHEVLEREATSRFYCTRIESFRPPSNCYPDKCTVCSKRIWAGDKIAQHAQKHTVRHLSCKP